MSNLLATLDFGDAGGRVDDARELLFPDPVDLARNAAPWDDSREILAVGVPVDCNTAIVGSSPTPSPPELDDSVMGEIVVLSELDIPGPSRVRLITSILRKMRGIEGIPQDKCCSPEAQG